MEENKNLTKDGNLVAEYLRDMSSKARSVGRNLVYSIIACSWTLSYIDKAFVPTENIKWALALALIYLFLDLTHYVLMTAVYKYILVDYFDPTVEGDFVYKEGKNAGNCTHTWMNVGFVWLILMSLLLIASSILMILHVLSLQPTSIIS